MSYVFIDYWFGEYNNTALCMFRTFSFAGLAHTRFHSRGSFPDLMRAPSLSRQMA